MVFKYTKNGNNYIVLLEGGVLIYLSHTEFNALDIKQFYTSDSIRNEILTNIFLVKCSSNMSKSNNTPDATEVPKLNDIPKLNKVPKSTNAIRHTANSFYNNK